jgi:hypothetical protein
MRQAFGDTVEVRLATDQSDIGMLLGLPDQMFAGAEADLEPDLATGPNRAAGSICCGAAGRAIKSCGSRVSSSASWPDRSFLPRRRP